MKKLLVVLVVIVIAMTSVLALTGCGGSSPKDGSSFEVTYSEADWKASIGKVKPNNVALAAGGVSDYTIVYPDALDAPFVLPEGKEELTPIEDNRLTLKNAVDFLAMAMGKIVGCNFVKVAKSQFGGGNAIELSVDSADARIKNDGYGIKIDSGLIAITGLGYVGIENGIYDFLEEYLGCMFVTQGYDYFPTLATINLQKSDTFHNPDMIWRNVYANASNNMGGNKEGEIQWDRKIKLNGAGMNGWGNWCHTFFTYLPPDEFFAEHPEYYGEYNGVRKYEVGPVAGQLCLTNEDVYRIISERLFKLMTDNPETKYWDVSQMDTWIDKGTGCTCRDCKKLDDQEGSPMGSLLTFINRLADECAIKFPENFISTLAYNYSIQPPKNIVPRDNVIIKLCFMPGDVASDIKNPRSKEQLASQEVIKAWSAISKHLLIWDYNVDFHQYLMPYPIFSAMQDSNDYYLDNNVFGVFHQMDYDKGGYGEEISAYIFAKIMWDRTVKVEDIMDKYLAVTYGNAADEVAELYSLLEKNVYDANRPLYIYSTVGANTGDYLSIANVNKYLKIMERAEEDAAGDKALIARLDLIKMSLLYVKAQEGSFDKASRLAALNEFKEICDANGIDSIYEGNPKKDNEVQTFYDQQLSLINALPWIIVAIVVGSIALVAGAVLIIVFYKKAIKRKKIGAKSQ